MRNETNILKIYLEQINKIPLLTREEEIELAMKAKNGDKVAKDKIVNANLRFVVNIAKKYQNRGLELTDLISEGNVGLINAIEHFEVNKGWHFISYAVWWIRQAILKAISEKSRAIRLPQNRASDICKIEQAKKVVGLTGNENSDFKAIAEVVGMDENLVRDLINISMEMLSLDCPIVNEDGDITDFMNLFPCVANETPEDMAISKAMKEDIDQTLATLRPDEAEILQMRYGLNGEEPMTLKEVGIKYNLSKERIRQIEKQALNHIRQPSRAARLAGYVAA